MSEDGGVQSYCLQNGILHFKPMFHFEVPAKGLAAA